MPAGRVLSGAEPYQAFTGMPASNCGTGLCASGDFTRLRYTESASMTVDTNPFPGQRGPTMPRIVSFRARYPNRLAEILPGTGPPSVAALRRYAKQRPEMEPGRTRPLDAWYDSVLDPSGPPADKPRYTGDQKLLHLVDAVAALRAPGGLSTVILLLEGSAKAHHSFGGIAAKLAREVKRDGQRHMLIELMADSTGRLCVLVWACRGLHESDDSAEQDLSDYLAAKKYQVKGYRATCLVFDPGTVELQRIIFDNRINHPDKSLERRAPTTGSTGPNDTHACRGVTPSRQTLRWLPRWVVDAPVLGPC